MLLPPTILLLLAPVLASDLTNEDRGVKTSDISALNFNPARDAPRSDPVLLASTGGGEDGGGGGVEEGGGRRGGGGDNIPALQTQNIITEELDNDDNDEDNALDDGYDTEQPYFDYEESGNVTALLGKTAILNCRVKNIANKTVSWVRHRDIHLLTVGRFTYTSDERFSARHTSGSDDWLLLVHYVQKRDEGMYECQISTTPPDSHLIHLSVVEAETVIVGGPDVYINTGSRLSLTCSVKYSPEPPAFIFWYHDDKLVSYDRTRVGVVVSDERGLVTTSRLLVQTADTRHSGNYTCSPANSHPKSVIVHVIAGDQPAAIVHENAAPSPLLHPLFHPLLLLLPCFLL